MKTLIYGTRNPSKLTAMIRSVEGLPVQIVGLNAVNADLPEAPENGKEPLDNAKEKATFYYQKLSQPVFSVDSGLFFKEVKPEDQPGVFIKRVNGTELNDTEMMAYYRNLAARYGGKLTAYYKNAVCLVMDKNNVHCFDGSSIHTDHFYLVDKPHRIIKAGFPLDSLSIDIKSGKYYYDLTEKQESNLGVITGFRNFFMQVLEEVL